MRCKIILNITIENLKTRHNKMNKQFSGSLLINDSLANQVRSVALRLANTYHKILFKNLLGHNIVKLMLYAIKYLNKIMDNNDRFEFLTATSETKIDFN